MPLPAAEHQRVLRETKDERNARAWVRRRGGTVEATPGFNGGRDTHYMVKIPGFHPQYGVNLVRVVGMLRFVVEHWVGELGPTKGRVRRPDGD